MTAFLYHRLALLGTIPRETLVRALGRSLVRHTSLCEALIALDVSLARSVSNAVADLGPAADEGWKPDRHLLMDLPPGICEHYLAFPFRERSGKVELATICAVDEAVRLEFEAHLGRPVVLYRARLQALLAAAKAPIDLDALGRFLSQPPPPPDGMALPLLRKNTGRSPQRQRVPTSPGLGRKAKSGAREPVIEFQPEPPGTNPGLGHIAIPTLTAPPMSIPPVTKRPRYGVGDLDGAERLESSQDFFELAAVLGQVLPAPTLIFEHAQGRLYLRITSGPGTYQDEVVFLHQESGFSRAAREGSYHGAFFDCAGHARYFASFPVGSPVLIRRIGAETKGLVVICSGEFEVGRARSLLDIAQRTSGRF